MDSFNTATRLAVAAHLAILALAGSEASAQFNPVVIRSPTHIGVTHNPFFNHTTIHPQHASARQRF